MLVDDSASTTSSMMAP